MAHKVLKLTSFVISRHVFLSRSAAALQLRDITLYINRNCSCCNPDLAGVAEDYHAGVFLCVMAPCRMVTGSDVLKMEGFFFIPDYFQSVPAHSANCV
jgi:hypothetical protein